MAKIKIADFYYGAVLSMLFNKNVNPALVESDENRQIYDFMTNNGSCRMFIKYRTDKINNRTRDYNSWQFVFSKNEIFEIKNYLKNDGNLSMALVCGIKKLNNSEIAILDKNEIGDLMKMNKTSMTISRKKNERSYRVSIGGGRGTALQVKANRFEDIFENYYEVML